VANNIDTIYIVIVCGVVLAKSMNLSVVQYEQGTLSIEKYRRGLLMQE
jgi:hypothetical protein